ncbi:hypothetical protein [Nocardioides houyundeii]|uniref:hypothetical protein n=1 Tax=Nocardioides houyundeii TaxID=2045452 RepID=UPI000DF13C03|nr:hypothetical protein [Nocardioides houyundeii]
MTRVVRRLAAVAALVLLATGCSTAPESRTEPSADRAVEESSPGATSTSSSPVPTGQVRAEFVATMSRHLCRAQDTVYDDPGALADAHRSLPEFATITESQAAALVEALSTDAPLTAELTAAVRSCT